MGFCLRIVLLCLAALSCAGGCTLIDRHAMAESKSPLAGATPSPDSVALEIFFARAAIGDAKLNGQLWNEIDEQRLPAELRRKLAENGIRAGVVGGNIPDDLAKLLTLTDEAVRKPDEPVPVGLDAEPTVTLRFLQSRSGKRNEVVCSHTYDELPLIQRVDNSVRGHTYQQAEGRLGLKAFPETPGRVQLELTPELHHGEQQPRWVGSDGILRLEAGRPREVFEELRMRLALAPGEMLVMTSLADHPGSLGHYFFTQPTSEQLAQKLLVIRIAQSGSDRAFSNEPAEKADMLTKLRE